MSGDVPGSAVAEVAVIGGSGFYAFLDEPEEHVVDTPYGAPSAPVAVGSVAGRRVAFLPRHGPGHEYPPHRINYRANLWALRSLGVRQVLAPCAVGGLRDGVAPGDVVVPDQLVDRTTGRAQSYVETGAVQCGFCTPGLVVAVKDLLERVPEPDDAQIREALAGNLCRCTGYAQIIDAVHLAASRSVR